MCVHESTRRVQRELKAIEVIMALLRSQREGIDIDAGMS